MTDLELIKKCAEKMGYEQTPESFEAENWYYDGDEFKLFHYDPLHNDAQAMALVKKFSLHINRWSVEDGHDWEVSLPDENYYINNKNLNRAVCKCVAKMGDVTDE